MPTGYQIKDQQAPHYITFQIVYWIDLFSRQVYRDIVVESLKYCQQNKQLEIFAYVIMSNHIHIIVRSSNGTLSDTIRDFKKFTSKRIVEHILNSNESRKEWMIRLFQHAAKRQNKEGKYQVWTHENHAIELYGNEFMRQKVNYIHENPVRSGIVDNAIDYKYSSARSYAEKPGLIDIIPVSFKWKTIA